MRVYKENKVSSKLKPIKTYRSIHWIYIKTYDVMVYTRLHCIVDNTL